MQTKLDRSNRAKINRLDSSPTTNTVGNIAIDESTDTLYYKSNDTWYSTTGALGGVFEAGTGNHSAQRIGVSLDIQADYSFAMGSTIDLTSSASYSAVFGLSIDCGGSYDFISGSHHTVSTSATHNIVTGYAHTLNTGCSYNVVGGRSHVAKGTDNAYFGSSHDTDDNNIFYNLISGYNNTLTSCSAAIVGGHNNDVQYGYGLTYGKNNENKKYYSTVYGKKAKAIWTGGRHFAGDEIEASAGAGTAQSMEICLHAQTTGTSHETMVLELGDINSPLYIPDGTTTYVKVTVLGSSDGSDTGAAVYENDLLITRVDPTTLFSVATGWSTIFQSGSTVGSPANTVDSTNMLLKIRVYGVGAINTNWVARIVALHVKGDYAIAPPV